MQVESQGKNGGPCPFMDPPTVTTTTVVAFGGEVTSVRVLLNLLKAIQIKNVRVYP